MRKRKKTATVLVAAKEDLLNNLNDALADTNFVLLHASTKREAIVLLQRRRSEINLAIVELELPDFGGWDLIRRLTFRPRKSVKVIATTSAYPEQYFERIKEIGVDAVVPKAIPQEAWRQTVEAMLLKSENGSEISTIS